MPGTPQLLRYAGGIDSWLEPAVLVALRHELPDLAEEIVRAIQREVPGYSRPLRGAFGRGIRSGVELALSRFIGDGDGDGESDGPASPAVYRSLGYGEANAGRTLDSLQSAYRVGATVAWQRMSQAASDTGASTETQRRLAEAMFAYIEHIAAESIAGYADAQLAQAGDLERRRTALFTKLLSSPALDPSSLEDAAAEAAWLLPATLACIVLDGHAAAPFARRLSGDTLRGHVGEWACLIVPDPARVESEAVRAAERLELPAGLGPSVVLADAHVSLRWAALARELSGANGGLVIAERRLADIALRASPDIVTALAARTLSPLDGETAASRARLEETLHAWLRHHGSQRAIAAELDVHPQTIRYRLRRLRELFGAGLEDPDSRFALEVALRAGLPPPARVSRRLEAGTRPRASQASMPPGNPLRESGSTSR